MKKMINYYYKLYPIKVYELYSEKYFFDDMHKYYICKIKEKEEINKYVKIYEHLNNNGIIINEIVKNKDNDYITTYENKLYVIIMVKDIESLEIDIEDIMKYNISIDKKLVSSVETNELDEMKKEIDYYEEIFVGYNKEYNLTQNFFNYYIGLGENAISYIDDTIKELGDFEKSLSHKKINEDLCNKDIIDIMNLSYNYSLKDTIEYIRILFVNDLDWALKLEQLINSKVLNEKEFRLIYGLMIYPKYFFDHIYKLINNKNINEKDYKDIIKNNEKKLNNLYILINKYCKIPSIWWINEKNNT